MTPLRGVLNIDKPEGPTSMDVCAMIRGRLRRGGAPKGVKVGHAGTLDPLATGVLVVLVGKATTLCDAFMGKPKGYLAEVDLSQRSATDDREGPLTPVEVAEAPGRERVEAVLRGFVGEIMQTPPAFSAIKSGGRRAYDLARQGRAVQLAARPVRVESITIAEYAFPRLMIDVACGKGTYIRSLARDVGLALGTGGMLAGLRRTRVGPFTLDRAVRLEAVPDPLGQQDLLVPEDWLSA